jgi:hypothetical protein
MNSAKAASAVEDGGRAFQLPEGFRGMSRALLKIGIAAAA